VFPDKYFKFFGKQLFPGKLALLGLLSVFQRCAL
jgi:hypothetical protein